jgi:uncharacterized protein YgbK (DUF1537 family)
MIGVIADDLTGAAELGAVGLRHGLKAEIVLAGTPSGQAELVCVDTDSRACAASEAAKRAAAGAEILHPANPAWLYKKTDSVLRGQVTAEVESLLSSLHRQSALLVPCNPSLGRIIRDGEYFIHGKPIHETEFSRDPTYPRRSPKVLELLASAAHGAIRVCKPGEPLPANGIVLGEAQTLEHLRFWAGQAAPGRLMGGGAEFFAALLEASGLKPLAAAQTANVADHPGAELFISGSTSIAARDFVSSARTKGTPIFSLPKELAKGGTLSAAQADALAAQIAAATRSHHRAIVQIGLPPVSDRTAAEALTCHLIALAAGALAKAPIDRIYAEGGATAVELVHRMGWQRLTVLQELAPGVACLAVQGDRPLQLIIKPGSYLWPESVRKGFKRAS